MRQQVDKISHEIQRPNIVKKMFVGNTLRQTRVKNENLNYK